MIIITHLLLGKYHINLCNAAAPPPPTLPTPPPPLALETWSTYHSPLGNVLIYLSWVLKRFVLLLIKINFHSFNYVSISKKTHIWTSDTQNASYTVKGGSVLYTIVSMLAKSLFYGLCMLHEYWRLNRFLISVILFYKMAGN